MTRVKGGTVSKTRRRKVLKEAKGYFGSKHRLYKTAQEQVFHSGAYAYRDRKQNKRNFRKLWITRINAACRLNNISYSKFMNGLAKAGIEINRKMLSEMAINDSSAFAELVKISNAALNGKVVKTEAKKEVKTAKTLEKKETQTKETKSSKAEAKKEVKVGSKKDYSTMTLAELKAVAKEQGVKGYSTMKKDELLKNLK